jgi:hypothetical protein
LRILNINFQSLRKKGKQLEAVIDSSNPDVIIGTETWLDPDINSAEVIPNYMGFDVYRRDRSDDHHGGVLIATKRELELEEITQSKNIELISGSIRLSNKKKLTLAAFYRPPSSVSETYLDLVKSEISGLHSKNKNNVLIIGGDFNVPDIDWKALSIAGHQNSARVNQTFLDLAAECSLEQQVDFPTRKQNTLDLIFTTHPSFKQRCKPLPPIGNSDHDIVLYDTSLQAFRSRPQRRKIHLWKKADIQGIKDDVKSYSHTTLNKSPMNVTEMWNDLKSALHGIIDKRVPTKMTAARYSHPWINTNIKRALRRKRRAHSKAKKTQKKKDSDRYKRLQHEARYLIKNASKTYMEETVNEAFTSSPKRFWSFIKSRGQEASGVPPLKNKSGFLKSDTPSKAEILNDQFKSVFTDEDLTSMPNKGPSPFQPMPDIIVEQKGVTKLLKNLKTEKATGPDSIPAFILKTAAEEISPVLTRLFQQSLDTGEVPDDWRNAWIVPIFKKGEKHQASNYRPVSLTSITCKLLEHIIHSSIMGHFDRNEILHNSQHGFRRHRSCETQLITTIHEVATSIAQGNQVDIILLDFSKAFDKVPHSRLLHKLNYYGVSSSTLRWIRSFLTDRKQEVLLEGTYSSQADVTSGVPQGTVLGPLLFLSFINDLPDVVGSSHTKLFADDCMLFRTINSLSDQQTLQTDLSALEQWEKDWQMDFNPSKCTVLRVMPSQKKKARETNYSLHGQTLEVTSDSKYLGVTINSTLTWSKHVDITAGKANRALGFLRRNINDCNTKVKSAAYITMVRPIMEYASSAWDPHTKKDAQKLESVQRRAARFARNNYRDKTPGCVDNMLKSLQWNSLEERRKTNRLIMLHKINNGLVGIDKGQYLKHSDPRTRGAQRFYQHRADHVVLANSFFPRTLREWNSLPVHTIANTKTETFRVGLGSLGPGHFPTTD